MWYPYYNVPLMTDPRQQYYGMGSINNDKSLHISNRVFRTAFGSVRQPVNRLFMEIMPVYPRNFSNNSSNHIRLLDTVATFKPVKTFGPNYANCCVGAPSEEEKNFDIVDCVKRYTSEGGWLCSKINTALNSDSQQLCSYEYSSYIKQLKYSIWNSPMRFSGTVFRGVELSSKEIELYEASTGPFFIPSFVSTSKTQSKAFNDKNVLLHIEISPDVRKFCMEMTPPFSDYNEDEILISCYSVYLYERTEKSNNQRIIKLRRLDFKTHYNGYVHS
ncbi:unnamed protein product [Adineta steineri]|uniref:NAD(P)(+)--arginine ADP-ribosyltransferase n=1 Tax=Adineta steineri TaxID=433720 RepID=A0A814WKC5_9BILA|nr:unnamed protein product [Adineta steineri]CAF1269860.1 unnamed protein product [Adineta steineri]CAF3594744.1 unnamed protein product [Adineta steineri]CAF4106111.1 unnamed protein product [Adineta steineri]